MHKNEATTKQTLTPAVCVSDTRQLLICRSNALRRDLDAAADAACTFTPRLNTETTNKLLWKSLSAPDASNPGRRRETLHDSFPSADSEGKATLSCTATSANPVNSLRYRLTQSVHSADCMAIFILAFFSAAHWHHILLTWICARGTTSSHCKR